MSREKFEPEPGIELRTPDLQTRDLEVRVRVPVQVQIFLWKCNNVNVQRHKL